MKSDIVIAAHPENPKFRISALFLGTWQYEQQSLDFQKGF